MLHIVACLIPSARERRAYFLGPPPRDWKEAGRLSTLLMLRIWGSGNFEDWK